MSRIFQYKCHSCDKNHYLKNPMSGAAEQIMHTYTQSHKERR